MKIVKKLIVSILVICMIVMNMSACGGSNSNGEVTLTWAMPLNYQTDYDTVLAAINEELANVLPNTKLEFLMDSSMSTKWSLWMAGKKNIDIALSGYSNDLSTEISKQSYTALDSLIEKYAPTIKAESEDYPSLYMTGTENDKLYAIPNIQIHVNDEVYMGAPQSLSSYLDVSKLQELAEQNPTSTEAFYEVLNNYLDKVFANKSLVDNDTVAPMIDVKYLYKNFAKRGYEFLGGNNATLCYKVFPATDNVQVVDFHDTPEFATFIKYTSMWYQKGYISKDVLTGADPGSRSWVLTSNITDFRQNDTDGDGVFVGGGSAPVVGISMTPEDQKSSGTSIIGSLKSYLSIPTTSKNPERAMQLLELLRTEKGAKLLNLIIYGQEGVQYEKTSDTTIKAFEYEGQASSSTSYGLSNWMCGSMLSGMYICSPYTETTRSNALKYYKELMPNFYKTPVYGLTMDNTAVANELTQISSVNDEFEIQLMGGVNADYTTVFNNMQTKMSAAGIDKVKQEYQTQIDNYIASK